MYRPPCEMMGREGGWFVGERGGLRSNNSNVTAELHRQVLYYNAHSRIMMRISHPWYNSFFPDSVKCKIDKFSKITNRQDKGGRTFILVLRTSHF